MLFDELNAKLQDIFHIVRRGPFVFGARVSAKVTDLLQTNRLQAHHKIPFHRQRQ